jgi:hypothetical protein
MKQSVLIYSATRGNVDGSAYSSVWAESQEVLNSADTIGKPPMKINCVPGLVDDLRGKLPAVFECDMKMISAGGARGGLFISSAVVLPAAASSFVPPVSTHK